MTKAGANASRRTSAWAARYILGLLFASNVCSFMDRMLVAILAQPIKAELGLSDFGLGLLNGPAFALTYAVFGFAFAYWADHGNRHILLAVVLFVWSLATSACGLAGTFTLLFVARIFVGVGEAGGNPAAMSIIPDIFPVERRSLAYSIFLSGAAIGVLLGAVLAGNVAMALGWRTAFIAIGAMGALFAAVFYFTMNEPARDGATSPAEHDAGFIVLLRGIWRDALTVIKIASAREILIGYAIASLLSFGILSWVPAFFMRHYNLSIAQAGTWFGLIIGTSSFAGMMLGGWISDRLVLRDRRWLIWWPTAAFFASIPLYGLTFNSGSVSAALVFFFLANLVAAMASGSVINAYQSSVPNRVRASAGALMMFSSTLLGIGAASVIIGAISDALTPSLGNGALGMALTLSLLSGVLACVHLMRAASSIAADMDRAGSR